MSESEDEGSPRAFAAASSDSEDPVDTLRGRARARAAAGISGSGDPEGVVLVYPDYAQGEPLPSEADVDAPLLQRTLGGALTGLTEGRAGTPEGAREGGDWGGYSEEMRRLLRQPRYFDEDFEAAALRCFRCGGSGHRERGCTAAPRERPCFLCGLFGHVSRECPNELCFNCSRPGHQSRECPEPRGAGAQYARCLRCGSRSHSLAVCERDYEEEDMQQVVCYVCGMAGHLSCAAPPDEVPDPSCFRCGEKNHYGFECTARLNGGGGGGGGGYRGGGTPVECFRCGGRGHLARDCPRNQSRAGHATQGMGFGGSSGVGPREANTPQPVREVTWRPNGGEERLFVTPNSQGVKRRREEEHGGARSAGPGREGTHRRWDNV